LNEAVNVEEPPQPGIFVSVTRDRGGFGGGGADVARIRKHGIVALTVPRAPDGTLWSRHVWRAADGSVVNVSRPLRQDEMQVAELVPEVAGLQRGGV
jgi:hypothetical protein